MLYLHIKSNNLKTLLLSFTWHFRPQRIYIFYVKSYVRPLTIPAKITMMIRFAAREPPLSTSHRRGANQQVRQLPNERHAYVGPFLPHF